MTRSERPVWIVVPARDEAATLAAAIAALETASARAAATVHLVVVDDGSTDATPAIAASAVAGWQNGSAIVLEGPSAGAGWARRTGLDHAVICALATGATDALVATTDADSIVPDDWIVRLLALADEGHAVIAGDIELERGADRRLADARDRRLAARLAEVRQTAPDAEHPNFAGANLACSASLLADLGPLPAPRALEDDALRALIDERGIAILRDASFPVTTSARLVGRATQGLARALRDDAIRLGADG